MPTTQTELFPSPDAGPGSLHQYDLIVINTSGGKDSIVMAWYIKQQAIAQNYPLNNLVLSHQVLTNSEWPGTHELLLQQAAYFDLRFITSTRKDRNNQPETLLEYIQRRQKWPSSQQRFCTSDFKRGPGFRVVTQLTRNFKSSKVLYCMGYRAQESPARAKKPAFAINERLTTSRRITYDWSPILHFTEDYIWHIIRTYKIPYHYAYDLGIKRFSCCFCILAPISQIVLAAEANPEGFNQYLLTERAIGHKFHKDYSLESVQQLLLQRQALRRDLGGPDLQYS